MKDGIHLCDSQAFGSTAHVPITRQSIMVESAILSAGSNPSSGEGMGSQPADNSRRQWGAKINHWAKAEGEKTGCQPADEAEGDWKGMGCGAWSVQVLGKCGSSTNHSTEYHGRVSDPSGKTTAVRQSGVVSEWRLGIGLGCTDVQMQYVQEPLLDGALGRTTLL